MKRAELLMILVTGSVLFCACGKEEPAMAAGTGASEPAKSALAKPVAEEPIAEETEAVTEETEIVTEETEPEEEEAPSLYSYDGDYLLFGSYEQDGDLSNGPEPIEWIILDQNENGTLLLSRYILAAQAFDSENKESSWEESTLRTWMNQDFYQEAFTEEQQELIRETTLKNPDNAFYMQGFEGNDTVDNVFCLGYDDIEKYFEYSVWDEANNIGRSQQLMAEPTKYATNNGVKTFKITSNDYNTIYKKDGYTKDIVGMKTCYWWLRQVGSTSASFCVVDYGGYTGWNRFYQVTYDDFGVRPALYVDLEQ